MKTWVAGLLGMYALVASTTLSVAQEPSGKAQRTEPRRVTVRLPRYFAQIGLDESEKGKIRAVVSEFDEKIASLQEEIEELQRERMLECERLLSSEQKVRLEELRVAAEARRKKSTTASRSKGERSEASRSNGQGSKDESDDEDDPDDR